MKIVNKTKKYLCLKINNTQEFYIELGRELGDKLEIVKEKDHLRFSDKTYYIYVNEKRINLSEIYGGYLIIDLETKRIQIIDNETLENDYYILEEI